jgi:glycosyltransferase involved in cell wall biosynthesis
MDILLISREALFPNIGGHREYLLSTVNMLANAGNNIDIFSWGPEENYNYNSGNLSECHIKSGDDKISSGSNFKFVRGVASSIGIGQIHTIRHKGIGLENFKDALKSNYDIVIKNGPDSNNIAYYIGKKYRIPVIERLDWVGLPYRSINYRKWLNYIGEKYMPYQYFHKYYDKFVTRMEAKSAYNADYIYTHTKEDMEKISKYTGNQKLSYIYPFLYEENGIKDNDIKIWDKFILFYGTPSINASEAIRYIYKISKLNTNIKYAITGNFLDEKKKYTTENLIFLGELPIKDFYNILKKAYFIIFPITLGHGIQMKLIRAFSFKKAVIATDGIVKPINELLDNDKNIFIAKTPEDFFHYILYLYENEDAVCNAGRMAYEIYKKQFSPEIHKNRIIDYLKNCRN